MVQQFFIAKTCNMAYFTLLLVVVLTYCQAYPMDFDGFDLWEFKDSFGRRHKMRKEGGPKGCKLIAFGDSLTDNGVGVNDEHGIKRYSNGDVWPEYLGPLLGCKKVDDRAYSGARSGMDNLYFDGWSGGVWQVDNFLQTEKVRRNTIVGYECTGANDLLYHITHNSLNPATLVPEIVTNNANNLKKLLAAGVTKIVIMDLFEGAAYSPHSKTDPANIPLFLQIVGAINAGVAQAVTQLKAAFPNAVIGHFVTAKVWETDIVPKFSVIDTPFSYYKPGTQFGDWKKYVWYDTLHLMDGVHEVLAEKMEEALVAAEA